MHPFIIFFTLLLTETMSITHRFAHHVAQLQVSIFAMAKQHSGSYSSAVERALWLWWQRHLAWSSCTVWSWHCRCRTHTQCNSPSVDFLCTYFFRSCGEIRQQQCTAIVHFFRLLLSLCHSLSLSLCGNPAESFIKWTLMRGNWLIDLLFIQSFFFFFFLKKR